MSAAQPDNIPVDIVPLILEQLVDRRDLHNCAQLCKSFNRAATPILYRCLDSRIRIDHKRLQRSTVLHPCRTLLRRPEYAKYVRYVTEIGAVGFNRPDLMADCCKALCLCTNLRGFTWCDDRADGTDENRNFLAYLEILQELPVQELTIRTFLGLSETIWAKLQEFTRLRKIAIWCMEGQPRILQGWSEKLGESLTHLELGRCAGVPASILVAVLSYLPRLKALRLKGAPSTAILEILTFLPDLVMLDTEYFGTGLSLYADEPLASLKELTVRTSSVHAEGFQQLWSWIRRLTPRPSLESFTLNAFSTQGEAMIPRRFLLDMAATHEHTLRHFRADSTQLTLDDIDCISTIFPMLESLSCSTTWNPDPERYGVAVARANNLRELRLNIDRVRMNIHHYMPPTDGRDLVLAPEHARNMMLREKSRLRVVGIGSVVYTGLWVQKYMDDGSKELEFVVVQDVVNDPWI